ncbi:O-antigen ligase family protein [[Clostridium] fimetarium]|uniref:O-antigen ligase-related domain-containing protein n=1 Tax=[Clostridium] fimetarium TaxID=99656 RepID=A0A1I0RLD0_9FIRM|nr:O-antigen ligase family protein [[Clostridium] fimetarium]SEW41991.1 hypothetical protein SAMN05421659_11852 [[Clostridium] fimetarium]
MKTGKLVLKFSSSSMLVFIFIIITLLEIRLFDLVQIPGVLSRIWSEANWTFVFCVMVVVTIIQVLKKPSIWYKSGFIRKYFRLLMVSLIIIVAYSIVIYQKQGIIYILYSCTDFLSVVFSLYILEIMKKKGDYKVIFNILLAFATIISGLCIVQSFIYSNGGPLFLQGASGAVMRNGKLRMSLGSFQMISTVYALYKCYGISNKNKIIGTIIFMINFFALLYAGQTRMQIIAVVLGCIVVIMLYTNTPIRSLIVCIFGFSVIIYLVYSGMLSGFFGTFSDESISDNNARFGALTFYWQHFLQNPLICFGFIVNPIYFSLKYGPFGKYYYVDVGVVGLLAQTGLFTIIIYIWPVIHWGKECINILKNKVYRNKYGFLVVLLVLVIATTPTLIITNSGRSFMWPVLFATYEFFSIRLNEDRRNILNGN